MCWILVRHGPRFMSCQSNSLKACAGPLLPCSTSMCSLVVSVACSFLAQLGIVLRRFGLFEIGSLIILQGARYEKTLTLTALLSACSRRQRFAPRDVLFGDWRCMSPLQVQGACNPRKPSIIQSTKDEGISRISKRVNPSLRVNVVSSSGASHPEHSLKSWLPTLGSAFAEK